MQKLESEGRFDAKVTAADLGETDNGKPFVNFTFETSEGIIWGNLYLSEAAIDRSLKTLAEVFAFNGDFADMDQFVGKDCSIVTEAEEYNGETRIKVKWINAKGGPKLDPASRASLAERLNAKYSRKSGSAAAAKDDGEPF